MGQTIQATQPERLNQQCSIQFSDKPIEPQGGSAASGPLGFFRVCWLRIALERSRIKRGSNPSGD